MKKIIIAVIVVALVILAWLYLIPRDNPLTLPLPADTTANRPWIEVESDEVVRVDQSGAVLDTFATGDMVEEGVIISTDAKGSANIYFADGSTLRIDPNTKLTITEGTFDEETGSLRVKVALSVGKVWSKITALVGAESHWEVNTGTAVATVRGSAFGTEVTVDGETLIVGSEHDVFVAPIDPETGDLIDDAWVVVGEKETLNFRKEIIKQIKDLKPEERKVGATKLLARQLRGEDHPLGDWARHNEAEDVAIREKVRELKDSGLDGRELRSEIRTYLRSDQGTQDFETELELASPERLENVRLESDQEPKSSEVELIPQPSAPVPVRPKAQIESLQIIKDTAGLKLVEGGTIEFKAVLVLSDGSKKSVTGLVDWQVVGSIGRMQKPGVFEAVLGNDVSEIGTAFGAVTARYTADDGKDFIAKSEIITVTGRVDKVDERG